MHVVKNMEMNTVSYDEKLDDLVEIYFKQNEKILYVLNGERLCGVITNADFNKNRNNGKLVNENFKFIVSDGKKAEEQLIIEAENILGEYKNIIEVPVIDNEGKLLYEFLREGSVLDVMPGRFQALYGGNGKLAEYISELTLKPIRIATDYPEILKAYLSKYGCNMEVEVEQEFYDGEYYEAEQVFSDFEKRMFKEKLKKGQERIFLEVPVGQKMSSLTEPEKRRIGEAKRKTTYYYLQNYGFDSEVNVLAKQILGEEYCNQEFIDSQKMTSRFVIKEGLCYNIDYQSRYVNVINGRRITTDIPAETDRAIYVFGPCTVFGMIVDDAHTIPSNLQRLVVKYCNREVINEGIKGASLLESIRKFNRHAYNQGDIFIFMIMCGEEVDTVRDLFAAETIYSLTEYLDSIQLHDYFFDVPKHCNQIACEKISEYVFSIIKSKLKKSKIVEKDIGMSRKLSVETIENVQLQNYLCSLKKYKHEGRNGAIVMNCNPFTNGHLYLIQKAAEQVEHLYVFVVEENKSYFPFADRIELVKKGIAGKIMNVTVIPSGKFIISTETFPEYFVKDAWVAETYIDTSYDIDIFARYIAPSLSISIRFVGEEPFDYVTRQYNRDMITILPQHGVNVCVIPRKKDDEGNVISASTVRRLLDEENMEKIKDIVPDSTYKYLINFKRNL